MSDWNDFDKTTPVESNRRVPPPPWSRADVFWATEREKSYGALLKVHAYVRIGGELHTFCCWGPFVKPETQFDAGHYAACRMCRKALERGTGPRKVAGARRPLP